MLKFSLILCNSLGKWINRASLMLSAAQYFSSVSHHTCPNSSQPVPFGKKGQQYEMSSLITQSIFSRLLFGRHMADMFKSRLGMDRSASAASRRNLARRLSTRWLRRRRSATQGRRRMACGVTGEGPCEAARPADQYQCVQYSTG
jgi:hypothetical protein